MKTEYYIDPNILKTPTFSFKKAFEYAKLMEQGVEFPAVNVYSNVHTDGRHRVAAAKLAGVKLKVKRSYYK